MICLIKSIKAYEEKNESAIGGKTVYYRTLFQQILWQQTGW